MSISSSSLRHAKHPIKHTIAADCGTSAARFNAEYNCPVRTYQRLLDERGHRGGGGLESPGAHP